MATARITSELVAVLPNRIGLLAEVTAALKDAGVNIVGIGAYEKEGRGEFMLVTSDNQAASAALRNLGAEVTEHNALEVEMPNVPGALEAVAGAISAAGIDIRWAYASASPAEGGAVAIVKTVDDQAALAALS